MTTPKPTCVHCGQPYGRRATTDEVVRWDTPTKEVEQFYTDRLTGQTIITGKMVVLDGEPNPPPRYTGNGIVVKNGHAYLSGDNHRMVMYRTIWDGESWVGGYEPFCTLRCALDYARKAYARATAARPRVVSK